MSYQDYVIRDGKFVGRFEEMYQAFSDPWSQSAESSRNDSRRLIALNWISALSKDGGIVPRVCEIGCGYGHLTGSLCSQGIDAFGIDVSSTAIDRAREGYPTSRFLVSRFENFEIYREARTNVFLLSEISWYVLDSLKLFKEFLTEQAAFLKAPVYLVHLLTVYDEGEQKYGREYFTSEAEIIKFFNFSVIESGTILTARRESRFTRGTYLIARVGSGD